MPCALRFLVIAEGQFGPLTSKTASSCIRYTPERVAAVIDSRRAGRTSQDVLGFGGDIPVVRNRLFEARTVLHDTLALFRLIPEIGRVNLFF